jgi:hypothetical protein
VDSRAREKMSKPSKRDACLSHVYVDFSANADLLIDEETMFP